jgi:hypothetical protein
MYQDVQINRERAQQVDHGYGIDAKRRKVGVTMATYNIFNIVVLSIACVLTAANSQARIITPDVTAVAQAPYQVLALDSPLSVRQFFGDGLVSLQGDLESLGQDLVRTPTVFTYGPGTIRNVNLREPGLYGSGLLLTSPDRTSPAVAYDFSFAYSTVSGYLDVSGWPFPWLLSNVYSTRNSGRSWFYGADGAHLSIPSSLNHTDILGGETGLYEPGFVPWGFCYGDYFWYYPDVLYGYYLSYYLDGSSVASEPIVAAGSGEDTLLVAVPEPSTVFLLGLGTLAFLVRSRYQHPKGRLRGTVLSHLSNSAK